MTTYVALLRGINVGGNHIVKMAELRALCERLGLADVRTHIQSGNIVFATAEDPATLRARLETEMEQAFGFTIPVILRTADELTAIVADFPFSPEEREAARACSNGKETEYVFLWNDAPSPDALAKYNGKDLFAFRGRELYVIRCNTNDSKLFTQIAKAVPDATARNLRVLSAVATLGAIQD